MRGSTSLYLRVGVFFCWQWHPVLRQIQDRLEENTGLRFNSVLCNLYRDCKDSVDWHADDEPVFGENPTIASISLGCTRNFDLKKRAPSVSFNLCPGKHLPVSCKCSSLCLRLHFSIMEYGFTKKILIKHPIRVPILGDRETSLEATEHRNDC